MVCVSALWCLSQHLPSYLGFSYLGCGVSLHSCSSKVQPLLLSLDEGYLLTDAPPDLEHALPSEPPGKSPMDRAAEARRLRRTAQKRGREALPLIQGQGRRPGGATPRPEVRGRSRQEQPHVQGAVGALAQEGREGFQVSSVVIQKCYRLYSIYSYYKITAIFLCAVQYIFMLIYFIHSSCVT